MAFREQTTYVGTPCKSCGETKRYFANGNCVSCCHRQNTVWRTGHPTAWNTIQRRSALSRYNFTIDEYAAMYDEQEGKCAICGCEADRLDVDHSHLTDRIRGLLCGPCNRAIGIMADDPSRLRKAADYLERQAI